MKSLPYIILAAALLPLSAHASTAPAATACDDVKALGAKWAEALSSRDAAKISSLYDAKAVLLATFSDELDSSAEIREYFSGLTKKPGLSVRYDKENLRPLDENTVTHSGLYTFSYQDEKGAKVEVPARFVFVWEKGSEGWRIVEHHSSTRPESAAATAEKEGGKGSRNGGKVAAH